METDDRNMRIKLHLPEQSISTIKARRGMTTDDLRAWQSAMGYTYESAAKALGINRATYADLLTGVSRTTGKLKTIDRRTELACAAISAGLASGLGLETI